MRISCIHRTHFLKTYFKEKICNRFLAMRRPHCYAHNKVLLGSFTRSSLPPVSPTCVWGLANDHQYSDCPQSPSRHVWSNQLPSVYKYTYVLGLYYDHQKGDCPQGLRLYFGPMPSPSVPLPRYGDGPMTTSSKGSCPQGPGHFVRPTTPIATLCIPSCVR